MRKYLLLMIGGFSLLSAGCGPMNVAPLSTYTITNWPKKTSYARHASSRQILLVTQPVASSGYASSRMIYVLVPYQLKAFADHAWVAPPAQLLQPLLINSLRRAGYFKAVVGTLASGIPNYQLNTRLMMLQQEFLQPMSQVRLIMDATLIKVSSGRVIANRVFEEDVPADSSPYGGVLATNAAADHMATRITKFVMRHLGARRLHRLG